MCSNVILRQNSAAEEVLSSSTASIIVETTLSDVCVGFKTWVNIRNYGFGYWRCDGCFCISVSLYEPRGIRWQGQRENHAEGFNLCFRCYPRRGIVHTGYEDFKAIGERFEPESKDAQTSEEADVSLGEDAQESVGGVLMVKLLPVDIYNTNRRGLCVS
ncbi:hypothetical protein F5Y14DRAFT_128957 [Nemania sp. NC0429]|nr:hypothetical protein F5Y14DRAFT_128957 [Nemania sp. NC0429]